MRWALCSVYVINYTMPSHDLGQQKVNGSSGINLIDKNVINPAFDVSVYYICGCKLKANSGH